MLHQLLDRRCRQILFKLKGFDDGAGFGEDIALDEAFVAVHGVPFATDRHFHYCVELLGTLERMWDFFNPVLLRKLLITLLRFVDLHARQLGVLTLLLELGNLIVPYFLASFDFELVFAVVNTLTGPLAPALFDVDLLDLLAEMLLNFGIFFFFEFFDCVVILRHKEVFEHVIIFFDQLLRLGFEALQVGVSVEDDTEWLLAVFGCRLLQA